MRKKWSEQAEETMGDYLCGQVSYFLQLYTFTLSLCGQVSSFLQLKLCYYLNHFYFKNSTVAVIFTEWSGFLETVSVYNLNT